MSEAWSFNKNFSFFPLRSDMCIITVNTNLTSFHWSLWHLCYHNFCADWTQLLVTDIQLRESKQTNESNSPLPSYKKATDMTGASVWMNEVKRDGGAGLNIRLMSACVQWNWQNESTFEQRCFPSWTSTSSKSNVNKSELCRRFEWIGTVLSQTCAHGVMNPAMHLSTSCRNRRTTK